MLLLPKKCFLHFLYLQYSLLDLVHILEEEVVLIHSLDLGLVQLVEIRGLLDVPHHVEVGHRGE